MNLLTTATALRESSTIPSGMVLIMAMLGLAIVFKAIIPISLMSATDLDVVAILKATTIYTKLTVWQLSDLINVGVRF